MKEKIRLLVIAPYDTLGKTIIQVSKDYPQVEVTLEVGCIQEGVQLMKKHNLDTYDAVLSRGGTKMEIEKNTTLPVFDIPISYYDLLNIIKLVEHYKGKVAILMYENIANAARTLCNILQFVCDIYIIDKWHNAGEKVEMLRQQGYSLIIGDAVSVKYAEKLGIQTILLTSGTDSVREAFEHVVQSCSYLANYKRVSQLYHDFHKANHEVFLSMTPEGRILDSTLPRELHRFHTVCRRLLPQVQEERQVVIRRNFKEGFFEISGVLISYHSKPITIFRIKRQHFTITDGRIPPYLTFYEPLKKSSAALPNLLQLTEPALWQHVQQAAKAKTAICVSGPAGSECSSFIRQLFSKSNRSQGPLYMIDAALLKISDIENLCSLQHSPLFITDASVHFKHLEALDSHLFTFLVDEIIAASYTSSASLFFSLEAKTGGEAIQERVHSLLDHFHALPVALPALAHKEDTILNYALLYIQHHNHLQNTHIIGMEPEAITLLCQYSWPRNLSQLQRVLQQAILSTDAPWITAKTLRQVLKNEERTFFPLSKDTLNLNRPLNQIIHSVILQVLQEEDLNQTRTAARLGISRTTLWRLLKENKGTGQP